MLEAGELEEFNDFVVNNKKYGCKYFFELDPIMGDRAIVNPDATSVNRSIDGEEKEEMESDFNENNNQSDSPASEDSLDDSNSSAGGSLKLGEGNALSKSKDTVESIDFSSDSDNSVSKNTADASAKRKATTQISTAVSKKATTKATTNTMNQASASKVLAKRNTTAGMTTPASKKASNQPNNMVLDERKSILKMPTLQALQKRKSQLFAFKKKYWT